jgi:hypothetical protein
LSSPTVINGASLLTRGYSYSRVFDTIGLDWRRQNRGKIKKIKKLRGGR